MYYAERRFMPVGDAVIISPARQVLLDAADYIERVGWCQGIISDVDGQVCALEAITDVGGIANVAWKVCLEASRILSTFLGVGGIALWNDMPGRTKEEVTNALRQAARCPAPGGDGKE